MLIGITAFLGTGCSIHVSKIDLDGNYQDYKINETKTVKVGSAMLSKIAYKNSCYDYVALIDYRTPSAAATSPAEIKKGKQYAACFEDPADPNSVLIKGIHAYGRYFLRIQKSGTIGGNGGWYNIGGDYNVRMFQTSWTEETLFALSEAKYYPGFDSFSERIVYLGMTDGKVRIGYRSESFNASKPSDDLDLIFDLGGDNLIACRNYTLKVLKADTANITFMVVDDTAI